MAPHKELEMFGFRLRKSRVQRQCWNCDVVIEPGMKYWRFGVKYDGCVSSVVTCNRRSTGCETVPEMLDQCEEMHPAVLEPSITAWVAAHNLTPGGNNEGPSLP